MSPATKPSKAHGDAAEPEGSSGTSASGPELPAADTAPIHPASDIEAATEIPNPLLEDQEPGRRLAGLQQESDTGRHAVDRSRPESFVRKTR